MINGDVHAGKAMPLLPPMTGNRKHTTYKKCDFENGLLLFYPL